jgi:hypothetical protein
VRRRIRRAGWTGALFFVASVAGPWAGPAVAAPARVPFHICAVLPGLATPGDNFEIEAEGPKVGKSRADRVASVDASGCDSLGKIPVGKYRLTQTVNLGWQLARVYCWSASAPRLHRAKLDTELNMAKLKVKGPGSCIFLQVPPGTELPEPAPGSPDTPKSPSKPSTPGTNDKPGTNDEPGSTTVTSPTTTRPPAPVPPNPPK